MNAASPLTSSERPRSAVLRARMPNLARLDLISLRLVALCAEHGTLSCAAEEAHLSLSGASHRLARLERAFGVALFKRHHRGLAATREGLIVAEHARQMLDLLQRMSEGLASP